MYGNNILFYIQGRAKGLKSILNSRLSWWFLNLFYLFIAVTILFIEDKSYYDQYFQIYGGQSTSQKILLLSISPLEWRAMAKKMGFERSNFYRWEQGVWSQVLRELQKSDPYRIGITFSFTRRFDSHPKDIKSGRNIYWFSLSQDEKAVRPFFFHWSNKNFGISHFYRDTDGIIRRHYFPKDKLTFLEKMTGIHPESEYPIINFRGEKGRFKSFRLTDFIEKNYPDELLKDKYVLIGYKEGYDKIFLTPTGPMPQLELLANILDNIIENRWVHKLPQSLSIIYCTALFIGFIWLVSIGLPNVVLAFLFCFLSAFVVGFSAYVFNKFYIQMPVFVPLCLVAAIYLSTYCYMKSNKGKSV